VYTDQPATAGGTDGRAGLVVWAFLDIDGEPAAGQFMVQNDDILYVVKIGFFIRLRRGFSGVRKRVFLAEAIYFPINYFLLFFGRYRCG
jgi:hypothetical protein